MKIVFSAQAWEDYLHWQETDKRIDSLLRGICRDPHRGAGKPEPLRHALSGWWSRRIDEEHRLVYKVAGDSLFVAQLRYHY